MLFSRHSIRWGAATHEPKKDWASQKKINSEVCQVENQMYTSYICFLPSQDKVHNASRRFIRVSTPAFRQQAGHIVTLEFTPGRETAFGGRMPAVWMAAIWVKNMPTCATTPNITRFCLAGWALTYSYRPRSFRIRQTRILKDPLLFLLSSFPQRHTINNLRCGWTTSVMVWNATPNPKAIRGKGQNKNHKGGVKSVLLE